MSSQEMGSHLVKRVNNAVYHNPPVANGRIADIHINEAGSDWYYAWCAFFGFCAIVFLGFSRTKHRTERLFYYMTIAVLIMACIAYYTMGSNLGMTPIEVEFHRTWPRVRGDAREIFWVRYVEWAVTTPLIILELLLTAGAPVHFILWTMFMDEVMIIMGLVGAVTYTDYKWGFFAFGCAAMFVVLYNLIGQGRQYARRLGSDIHRCYLTCLIIVVIAWICYPICWGVSEGGNVIAPDSEAIYYGILDIITKGLFSFVFIAYHRKIDISRMGLRFRDYDEDFLISGFEGRREPKPEGFAVGGVRSAEPVGPEGEPVGPEGEPTQPSQRFWIPFVHSTPRWRRRRSQMSQAPDDAPVV